MPNPEPNPSPEPDPVVQTDDVAALRSEAAKRRRALRVVEAERDELSQRWDARNRQDVERMAAERFADPSDLWAVTSLEQMQGDDGLIDMEKAEAELQRVLTERPHWRKPEPIAHPNLHQGPRQTVEEPKTPSFGQSFKNELGR